MIGLTPRELEVVTLMLDGWSNAEIADALETSVGTIKAHVRSIYLRLGLNKVAVWAPKGKRLVSLEALRGARR